MQFGSVTPTVSQETRSAPQTVWASRLASGDYPHMRSAQRDPGGGWGDLMRGVVQARIFSTLVEQTSRCSDGAGEGVFALGDDTVVHVTYYPDWDGWSITAASSSAEASVLALDAFVDLLPPAIDHAADNKLPFSIVMAHPMGGAMVRTATVDRSPFAAIAENYPPAVRDQLSDLASLAGPPSGGRLFLMHGPPGTGKSRMLQSLATEWESWCDVAYCVDPDEMFRTAAYLNDFLMSAPATGDRWNLLVLEDGDEFIDVGAKSKVGQGLSRLLNMADGFLGQATRTMVLISTNVDHEDFQPAAIRAGRCAAQIEFPAFSADEATAWMTAHGIDAVAEGEMTLADLYALTP